MNKSIYLKLTAGILVLVPVIITWVIPADAIVFTEWITIFNGPGNNHDDGHNIIVDDAGYVYIAGSSDSYTSAADYSILKLDHYGNILWAQSYDGTLGISDYTASIAVDNVGNVYVTGHSDGSGTGIDYATIKYSPDGVEQWVERYNGPGNGMDYAEDMAMDTSGNIYVTGSSYDSLLNNDYATVKYDTDGNELWVARHDAYTGSDDQARCVEVDPLGNIVVTGNTGVHINTIKYDNDGHILWIAQHDNARVYDLDLDLAGNVYICGVTDEYPAGDDFLTIKYGFDGSKCWEVRYNGPDDNNDKAVAMTVNPSGSVYVTGHSRGLGTGSDYATVAYDKDGTQLWSSRYEGPDNDYPQSIATDLSGYVYVTGYISEVPYYGHDYCTIAYDSYGNKVWEEVFKGSGGRDDRAWAMAIDPYGGVYVTGVSYSGSATYYDNVTIKYNTAPLCLYYAPFKVFPVLFLPE